MANDTPVKQRLVLCLDGTWNQQDSGTNVYHLSNLIEEGVVEDGCRQLVYYQEGVGTGMLDSVTGGAFGFGLSKNVRDAYDWLVEHYCDGDDVYVFGFSRGAFTARSLIGLISKCGLLRRGAPIPPEELWHAYQILGRYCNRRTGMEPAPNWWERIAGKPKKPFRELQELRPETPDHGEEQPANRAERLLLAWSRRVPIHCVGVFDTVGALGFDALAIPWLRDSTARFHDAHLTSLIVNGFQALAIDEHRASFAHIPWYGEPSADPKTDAKTVRGGRLAQRWFVGAHSNVGGGYEDDVLAQYPLAWMIDETRQLGLHFRSPGKDAPDPAKPLPCDACQPLREPVPAKAGLAAQAPTLRDSYSEFAGGIWKNFIRAKREYRHIRPEPELQNGQVVQSLNETLDGSVEKLIDPEGRDLPPNLWRYLTVHDKKTFTRPVHHYGEPRWSWWAWLVGWLALIALAGWTLGGVLESRLPPGLGSAPWHWLLAVAAPVLALLVDWRESVLNHEIALDPDGMEAEKRMAWMDWYLGIRLAAIAMATGGLGILAFHLGWTWLLRDLPPSKPLLGLLALTGLWIYFQAALAWNNGPMKEAGLDSIVELQRQRTPQTVQECLARWAKHKEDQQVLMPVVRSLWRDRLGFIPAYTVTLFLGSWLALWLGQRVLASILPPRYLWIPALAVALLCAIADYVEDWGELGYVRVYPEQPSRSAVAVTYAAIRVKFVLFALGLALTVAATLGLIVRLCFLRLGTISVIVALSALLISSGAVKSLMSGAARAQKKKMAGGTSGGDTLSALPGRLG